MSNNPDYVKNRLDDQINWYSTRSTENKKRLFKQGFSTGGSTGFGLFLSMKMIEVYGWTITEVGEYGKGAKFVITIPANLVSILEKNKDN